MWSNIYIRNGLRFFGLLLLQVLVLKSLSPGWENFNYIQVLLYPLFILLLPLRVPHFVAVLLGFVMGLGIDLFYDSLGVHASAGTFTGFVRHYVLMLLQPRDGYNVNLSPTKANMGFQWFLLYASILLFVHLLWLFSVEAFTLYYWGEILLKTFSTYIVSMGLLLVYQFLFNPKT